MSVLKCFRHAFKKITNFQVCLSKDQIKLHLEIQIKALYKCFTFKFVILFPLFIFLIKLNQRRDEISWETKLFDGLYSSHLLIYIRFLEGTYQWISSRDLTLLGFLYRDIWCRSFEGHITRISLRVSFQGHYNIWVSLRGFSVMWIF